MLFNVFSSHETRKRRPFGQVKRDNYEIFALYYSSKRIGDIWLVALF